LWELHDREVERAPKALVFKFWVELLLKKHTHTFQDLLMLLSTVYHISDRIYAS